MVCPNCGKGTALRDYNPTEYRRIKVENALRSSRIRIKNGKKSGPPARIDKKRVLSLRKLGLTLREIGKEMDCSFHWVYKIIKASELK